MTRMQVGIVALLAALASLTTGCAISRSEVKLSGPAEEAAAPATGRAVVIRSVTDERAFQDKPSDPSTPSLGEGGASAATADVKARAFGRKRNTYGMAMGDVLLEPGNTIEKVVRENLAAALRAAGFQVRDSAGGNALQVDARIRKFWAWVTPGFAVVNVEMMIETDVSAPGMPSQAIAVRSHDGRMMVTDDVWIDVAQKTLKDYRAKASEALRAWR